MTVPDLGLGINPFGPSTFANLLTTFIIAGVVTATSKSIFPSLYFSSNSSVPIKSAPALFASVAFSPSTNATTLTSLPNECGNVNEPLTFWSDFLGSIPKLTATSTDSTNFLLG